ncbi:MAG TPA: hydantoinase/oxoprolinase family protein [Stellaceae bacterium]|nr:hydantoinase/oxoprolinase family protein [Stellaceae bacterium]
MSMILGWDLGGAHLKLALLEDGVPTLVRQVACPLWQGLDHLRRAIGEGLQGIEARCHAVTMTGELSDLFPDRRAGVAALLGVLQEAAPGEIAVYGVDGEFRSVEETHAAPERAASANWHASVRLAAHHAESGLFLDIGSTTTDLVVFEGGAPLAFGLSDAERLASGELIYQGVVRTPVMAVARAAWFAGQRVGLANEFFATMADIYRLTGDLPPHADQQPSADGRGKSLFLSRARLARMIGEDASAAEDWAWDRLAGGLARAQLAFIEAGIEQVLSRVPLDPKAPFIGAGVGRFLGAELARRWRHPYQSFDELLAYTGAAPTAADCAPAVAVASLLAMRRTNPGSSASARLPRVKAERKPR